LTPYPGTALNRRLAAEGRITTGDWDLYDTRHAVFRPAKMTADTLEEGYRRAYHDFYRWGSILRAASAKDRWTARLRHVAYTAGWKKLEPLWDRVIGARRISGMLPLLEAVLAGLGRPPRLDEPGRRARREVEPSELRGRPVPLAPELRPGSDGT
jgi:hypothetical protein